jgi:hypothetical protein
MASAQKAWIERIQKRLAVTSTMLGDMKAAQMLGLKDLLFNYYQRVAGTGTQRFAAIQKNYGYSRCIV